MGKKNSSDIKKESPEAEKTWDNPKDPEKAEDRRNAEQIERQAEEASRRNKNLTDEPKD